MYHATQSAKLQLGPCLVKSHPWTEIIFRIIFRSQGTFFQWTNSRYLDGKSYVSADYGKENTKLRYRIYPAVHHCASWLYLIWTSFRRRRENLDSSRLRVDRLSSRRYNIAAGWWKGEGGGGGGGGNERGWRVVCWKWQDRVAAVAEPEGGEGTQR